MMLAPVHVARERSHCFDEACAAGLGPVEVDVVGGSWQGETLDLSRSCEVFAQKLEVCGP
jgi:hypothetical protein